MTHTSSSHQQITWYFAFITDTDGHSGKLEEGGIFNDPTTEPMSQLVKYAIPKAGQPSKAAPAPATAQDVNKAFIQSDVRTFTRCAVAGRSSRSEDGNASLLPLVRIHGAYCL